MFLLFYYYFIIRDEFEFNDLDYCMLISMLNPNINGMVNKIKPFGRDV